MLRKRAAQWLGEVLLVAIVILGFATVTSSTSYARNHDQSGYDESPFLLNYNSLSPLYYGSYPRPTTEFFTNSTSTATARR